MKASTRILKKSQHPQMTTSSKPQWEWSISAPQNNSIWIPSLQSKWSSLDTATPGVFASKKISPKSPVIWGFWMPTEPTKVIQALLWKFFINASKLPRHSKSTATCCKTTCSVSCRTAKSITGRWAWTYEASTMTGKPTKAFSPNHLTASQVDVTV